MLRAFGSFAKIEIVLIQSLPRALRCFVSNKILASLSQLWKRTYVSLSMAQWISCPRWELEILIVNSCTRCREIFKGLSQDVGRTDYMKTSAPHSLMTTYRLNLLSLRYVSLDSTFKSSTLYVQYSTCLNKVTVFYTDIIMRNLVVFK